MKPIFTLFAVGCVATFAITLSPVRALAQCEPLKSRLSQARALEEILRRNAANRRELHNSVYNRYQPLMEALEQSAANCKQWGPDSSECRARQNADRLLSDHLGVTIDSINSRLARIQADLDEVSGKLEATVKDIKYVSGELEKCIQKEAAAAAARKKAAAQARSRARAAARARQRAAERERREAEEAARAAAAAAAVGAMIGTMGRRGVSRGRPRRGGGCPPGMRRSADNPNCHYPGGRRRR